MSTSFELVLDDTSPVVNYYPFAETLGAPNLLAGWNPFFSQSGFLSQVAQAGIGDSFHVTSLDGAALSIQWFGSGISVFGDASNAAYQVSLDGAEPLIGIPHQNVLVKLQNLESKQHSLALVVHTNSSIIDMSSFLIFDRAAINISTELLGAAISSEIIDITSPRWSFSGDWTEFSDPSLMSLTNESLRVSNSLGNTATITFTGSAVALTGIRSASHGHYNVTLDGTTTTFDGRSGWLEVSTLFLQAGLNETFEHTLTVTNADEASLALAAVNVTHVSGGTPFPRGTHTRITTATVVTLVSVIIFAVLAVATLITCIYFRRRRTRYHRPDFLSGNVPSSASPLDLKQMLSPLRGHRSTHIGKNSGDNFQDLRTACSYTSSEVGPTERIQRRDRDESPVVLFAHGMQEDIDPTSPLPYLRLSKMSSPSVAGFFERQTPKTEEVRESGVESIARQSILAYMRGQSRITHPRKSSFTAPEPSNRHSRRRSTITGIPLSQRPYDSIAQNSSASIAHTPPSRRSTRLHSSRRGKNRATLESLNTLSPDTSIPSISTLNFAQRWEEHSRSDSACSSEMTEEGSPTRPRYPSPKDKSSNILECPLSSKPREERRPPGLSYWKAPW